MVTSVLLSRSLRVQGRVKFEMQTNAGAQTSGKDDAHMKWICVKREKKRPVAKEARWSGRGQWEEGQSREGVQVRWDQVGGRERGRASGPGTLEYFCFVNGARSLLNNFRCEETALCTRSLHGVSEVSGRGTKSEKSEQTPLNPDSATRQEKEKGSTGVGWFKPGSLAVAGQVRGVGGRWDTRKTAT